MFVGLLKRNGELILFVKQVGAEEEKNRKALPSFFHPVPDLRN